MMLQWWERYRKRSRAARAAAAATLRKALLYVRLADRWQKRSKSAQAVRSWAEFLGKLTVVAGVLSFIFEAPERAKQRHYQAWQLINSARGAKGDAGRRIALRDLIRDHVEMRGIDLHDANLENMDFRSAIMPFANFTGAELTGANFSCKTGIFVSNYWIPFFRWCWKSSLEDARFRASLDHVDFSNAEMPRNGIGPAASEAQMASWKKRTPSVVSINPDALAIWDCKFDYSNMNGSVISNATLHRNSFLHANMRNGGLFYVNLGSANSFLHADLRGFTFFGVSFITKVGEGLSDFSDVDMSETQFNDHVVNENDLYNVILCRTRFSTGVSNRDCPK